MISRNSSIWILGDFSMPNIDWPTESILEGCWHRNVYISFLENLMNFNLQQMVTSPTRGSNILDLFLFNMSDQVHETKSLLPPGSSDHDIVFHEIKVNRGRPIQHVREIKCYLRRSNGQASNQTSKSMLTRTLSIIILIQTLLVYPSMMSWIVSALFTSPLKKTKSVVIYPGLTTQSDFVAL
jgi:hypothetical protein